MCGICGICLREPGASVPGELLKQMTTVLTHRGPDGTGYLVKGNIGLGHTRLSIIDLDAGDQPIYNEDSSIGVVFNGEIYNYVELMADLIARGHRFRTHSDTEVIVHLYEEYGERCVDHLRGMFAFAVWNGHDGSVFLARDRLGIKPLFYLQADERFVFASELKSLLCDRSIAREVDIEVLSEYLALGYVPGDRCIVRGTSKLAPGHTLTWLHGRIDVRKYWDVNCRVDTLRGADGYVEEFDSVLQEAVRLHLRADVCVGMFLSGGVDSATITALASRQLGTPVKTFSVGFAEEDYSELAVARETADRYQTQHHEIIVRDRDVSVLPDIVWHLDEPFADPSALPTYYVCREAAKHVKVCLSGDGADEILGGYTRYRDAMAYKWVDWIPAAIRRMVCDPASALMPRFMWGKGLIERIGATGARRYLDLAGVFSAKECAGLLPQRAEAPSGGISRSLDRFWANADGDLLTTLQTVDQKTYLPDDILVKVDRMAMQNSLEVRPPFLDHKVVEFANACPPNLKVNNGVGKVILKAAMRDRLPEAVINRRKMGFGIPIKDWFRGGMEHAAADMLLGASARSGRFLERRAVEGVLRGHGRGMRDLSRKIWSLLVFEQWCRTYRV